MFKRQHVVVFAVLLLQSFFAAPTFAADCNNNQIPDELDIAGSNFDLTTVYSNSGFQPADIDGDGHMDVLSASASFGGDKIAWFENNGSQSFTERVISSNADGGHWVYAADIDGDGDMDVLSASSTDDKIAWYENDGNAEPSFTKRDITTSALC